MNVTTVLAVLNEGLGSDGFFYWHNMAAHKSQFTSPPERATNTTFATSSYSAEGDSKEGARSKYAFASSETVSCNPAHRITKFTRPSASAWWLNLQKWPAAHNVQNLIWEISHSPNSFISPSPQSHFESSSKFYSHVCNLILMTSR